ncbi:MAG: hypothetical protein RIA09_15905 [Hoeflea sp.]|jgi:hypothetical protein|uniref:hypothetical protein n=1 Tax=Hoeflea sp. TaxID=1940281 RepID=UPI0032F00E9E
MAFAIIGRLEYDDEDTCIIVDMPTREHAKKEFRESMKSRLERGDNRQIYINYVLESDGRLEIVEQPY